MPAPPYNKIIRQVLLLGLLLSAPARAEVLGWEACVREAAGNNADLRIAQANLAAARDRVAAARSGFFPQLSAGASYSDSEGSAVVGTQPIYGATVTATQNLFAGFQDSARVEQAEGNRAAAEASHAIARARLSQELKLAYAGLLYAQENIELTARIVQRLKENLRLVELRFEGGRENKGSFLLTKATLAQAGYENLQARQALAASQAQLARALGRSVAADLAVSGQPPLVEPPPLPPLHVLVAQTPDYQLVQAQHQTASADLRLARAGFYPSVNLSGTMAREGGEWTPEDDRRTVTASVSVLLFSGGKDYYGSRAAAASLDAASLNKDSVERQLLLRLQQAYNAYVESVEKLKVDEAFVEAAEARARIARSKYNNGLMTFEDWDRIENDLILRQKAALISQRERVAAEAGWELVQGKGVIP